MLSASRRIIRSAARSKDAAKWIQCANKNVQISSQPMTNAISTRLFSSGGESHTWYSTLSLHFKVVCAFMLFGSGFLFCRVQHLKSPRGVADTLERFVSNEKITLSALGRLQKSLLKHKTTAFDSLNANLSEILPRVLANFQNNVAIAGTGLSCLSLIAASDVESVDRVVYNGAVVESVELISLHKDDVTICQEGASIISMACLTSYKSAVIALRSNATDALTVLLSHHANDKMIARNATLAVSALAALRFPSAPVEASEARFVSNCTSSNGLCQVLVNGIQAASDEDTLIDLMNCAADLSHGRESIKAKFTELQLDEVAAKRIGGMNVKRREMAENATKRF